MCHKPPDPTLEVQASTLLSLSPSCPRLAYLFLLSRDAHNLESADCATVSRGLPRKRSCGTMRGISYRMSNISRTDSVSIPFLYFLNWVRSGAVQSNNRETWSQSVVLAEIEVARHGLGGPRPSDFADARPRSCGFPDQHRKHPV